MYANIAPPAGHTGAQLPRENFVTRLLSPPVNASSNISKHRSALSECAADACFMVHLSGSSGFGHFKCDAEFLIHTNRQLCRCAKIAAIVRPLPFFPGGCALQARGSRCLSRI